MSLYRNQLEAWLKTIDVKADRVLDIGGGQKPLPGRTKTWDVKEYVVADNDPQFDPQILMDINNSIVDQFGMVIPEFDVLFCLEVFEYIYNPMVAMDNIWHLLKENGVAYISFPTIYPLHNPPGIDFLRYSKNAIEKYLKIFGFKTWEITPRVATEGRRALADFYSMEAMRPMKDTMDIYDLGYMVKVIKGE